MKLSVVVVAYNMARELPRTLFSLSPHFQLQMEYEDYEIIVVDNGSEIPVKISGDFKNTRLIRIDEATHSPVAAVNLGLAQARGDLVGVMIDGARMASPGLLEKVALAGRLHARPIISTHGFHLGPEVQMKSVEKGYGAQQEDVLLDSIDWENDGYRLFEIAVFAGSSIKGWFLPVAESNALFLTREMWRELGGYDEFFVTPGGGLVNLDTYLRAGELPESCLVTLLGEGTFHQVHGGVATNQKRDDANWNVFHEEYRLIRGRAFQPPKRQAILLGQLHPAVLPSVSISVDICREDARLSTKGE